MKNTLIITFKLVVLAMFAVSCTKEEGEGGKANIEGTIYKIVDDGAIKEAADGSFVFAPDTVVAADQDVFIIYGGNSADIFDDDTKTSADGRFAFRYLREGDYTVFAYNELASSEMEAIYRNVIVGESGTFKVEDIYVKDGKNVGCSGIVGKIECSWDDGIHAAGVGLRVYLRKKGSVAPVEDTRGDDRGYFAFAKLEPNTEYVIWGEHETDKNCDIIPVYANVKTGEVGTIVNITDEPIKVSAY
jgi:hypothetical protein